VEVLDCGNAGPDSGGEVPVHIQERTREVPDRTVETLDSGGVGRWRYSSLEYWMRWTYQGEFYVSRVERVDSVQRE